MKKAHIVIGAAFGDEGKGLMTDYYASHYGDKTLVVRFNGGAQAGHTVETPEGMRHIFSHFGSGTLAGAHTYLSRFFVCNPILFLKEYDILKNKAQNIIVHVDPQSPITTPYDMMINQIAEDSRGNKRHGSCGMGFGETIERDLQRQFALRYGDLFNKNTLEQKLNIIRKEWVLSRLEKLGIASVSQEWRERISNNDIALRFMADIEKFLQLTRAAPADFLSVTEQHVVFEGAQGLLLDQTRGSFPHVTRSNTGLKNALALAVDAGFKNLDVTYAIRAYATRHGAGPMRHELPQAPYSGIKDETNITNAWQGTLRFGWLDSNLLAQSIRDDLSDATADITIRHGLAVTCLDQVNDIITFIHDGIENTVDKNDFVQKLAAKTRASFVLTSHGPTRATIKTL